MAISMKHEAGKIRFSIVAVSTAVKTHKAYENSRSVALLDGLYAAVGLVRCCHLWQVNINSAWSMLM